MKHASLYVLCALTLAAFGCSQQSKEEYHQAGQSLTHAAKETGQAVTHDAKVAAQAAKNATEAAKTTVDNKRAENAKHPATDNHAAKTQSH
jgi:hypothetical protein